MKAIEFFNLKSQNRTICDKVYLLILGDERGALVTRFIKKLLHILPDRDMSRSQFRKKAGISTNALPQQGKDGSLPLETLEKVCAALDCALDDILEYV